MQQSTAAAAAAAVSMNYGERSSIAHGADASRCSFRGARVARRASISRGRRGFRALPHNICWRAFAIDNVWRDAHARYLLTAARNFKHRLSQRALLLRKSSDYFCSIHKYRAELRVHKRK